MVVFPLPLCPTIAIVFPGSILNDKSSNIFTSSFNGYEKLTLSNTISPLGSSFGFIFFNETVLGL